MNLTTSKTLKMKAAHRLRLLFVWFGTRPGHIGGGVVRLLETNKVLHHYCDYRLITQKETYFWMKQLGLDADVLYFVGGSWAWIATIPALLGCVLSTILHRQQRFETDIIYSSTHSFLHVLPSLLLKFRYRAKLVVYVTLSPLPRFRGRSLLEFLLLWFDRTTSLFLMRLWSDRIIVVNRADAEELLNLGFHQKKIFVTGYGLDQEIIRKTQEFNREIDCVYLGRLAPAKGTTDLIHSWKEVTKFRNNARLTFVGPAWQDVLDDMKRQIRDLDLTSNVEIIGPLYDQDKYNILKKSKVMALPSYEDTWCIALSEAMACGCAAVAYDLPALRSVYGDSVMWAKTGNKNDMAKKIIILLENEAVRNEYVSRAKEFASKLDWKTIALEEFQNIESLKKAM